MVEAAFPVGTLVKVVLLRINEEKKQVSGSMKRSRIEELGGDEEEEAKEVQAKAKVKAK